MFKPLTGALRAFTTTGAAVAADLASAATYAVETVGDAVTGRRSGGAVLRVRVLILSDESGRPLCSPDDVLGSVRAAQRIFDAGAGTRVRLTEVTTITEPAPTPALDPRANRGLLLDDITGRLDFFRDHLEPSLIASPVTVVVVRDISGRATGCSLGMTADWVVCQAALFDAARPDTYDETVLAHELGHALNLPHHRDRANLMFPESSPPDRRRGTGLAAWQSMVLRTNRHTVHLPSGVA